MFQNFTLKRSIPRRDDETSSSFSGLTEFDIPTSCCRRPGKPACRRAVTKVNIRDIPKDKVFERGCAEALTNFAEENLIYLVSEQDLEPAAC